ncbi:hypothetical protein CRX72_16735 [Pantoea sp. BRM17]|nr:hypothetical protein CRX72_16735 [Pantoea sp. BRM17]
MITKLTSIVMAILVIALLYMGGQLLLNGGSAFYAMMGAGLLLSHAICYASELAKGAQSLRQ